MIKKKYTTVVGELGYDALIKHINSHDYFGFDTETTGLNPRRDEIIGASICGEEGVSFYIPYKTWSVKKSKLIEVWSEEKFKHIINLLLDKELLMWNGSFDVRVVQHSLGIDLSPAFLADVQMLKHTVEEEGDFALKKVAVQYQYEIGVNAEEEANKEQMELKKEVLANGGSWKQSQKDMYMARLEVMAPYAAADADYTLRLGNLFNNRLVEEGLEEFFYDKEVMPLYKEVTTVMEDNGVKVDTDLLDRMLYEITVDMHILKQEVEDTLMEDKRAQDWLFFKAKEKFPAKKSGNFGQELVSHFKIDLPVSEKSGKYSITKKNVMNKIKDGHPMKEFLLGDDSAINPKDAYEIQKRLWHRLYDGYLNISSKAHLGGIVFDFMKIKPLSKTDKGNPQFNDTMVQELADNYGFEWASKLSDYNKLQKIKSSYLERVRDKLYEGKYYFSYKQYGTISGRYGSDAQQMPRPKEVGELSDIVLKYNNSIRKLYIVEDGRVFIDDDFVSLEPHVFAHVSGDDGLKDIFRNGHDFYSTIAIKTENLLDYSPDKLAENYLGKVNKQLRQSAKAYSLGIPYGMSAFALGKTLDISTDSAKVLVEGYLSGFPELRSWMKRSEKQARELGYVTTETGRIRHLPKVKELYKRFKNKLLDFKFRKSIERKYGKEQVFKWYMDYKNGLNNAKNFQIQGLSASIVNRAAVAVMRSFAKNNIDGRVIAQIHDQLIFDVAEKDKDAARDIIQYEMENHYKISIDLEAPPEFAKNWADGH